MKRLVIPVSAAVLLMFVGACSSLDDETVTGVSSIPAESSRANVNFAVQRVSIAEGMDYSKEIIVLSKRMDGDVLVDYCIESSESEPEVDFSILTPNPCCIPAGEDRASFTIQTFSDNINEGEETIVVKLLGADYLQHGGDVQLGKGVLLYITISDFN